jgi:hypothetical protein
MSDLRAFTLCVRQKLVKETEALLLQIYGLETDGTFLPKAKLPILTRVPEAMATRKRLEKLFSDEQEANITPVDAHQKLVKEVAFTHLNRLVAFKLMEGRKLMRGAVDRYHDSNGFKIYLANHDADLKLFEKGSMPLDDFDEGPNDRAYRQFLLWQCGELAKEVRVLFDPENLASRLFPRPRVLREVVDKLNAEDMKAAWEPGNEETIGWIYQFFIAEEKNAAFDRVFKEKKKFQKSDIPAATQVFTPRWIVRFLVQNSLGRLWLAMHPDSKLADALDSLIPLPANLPKPALKPVKEIRVLDPATGTMHFGLVAFDLFVQMYREEQENAGKLGWPARASITREEEIPAAILANNLFGIDIDLRAVQLAALALYLRAKTAYKGAVLAESNLACADVAVFRGQHLANIAKEVGLPQGVTRELLQKFCESVAEASMMGSLVRLEEHFRNIEAERLRKAIDDYVALKAKQGIDESYFGNETSKGLRLLDVLTRRFDVVFTNPPYMSNRNMNSEMSQFMKRNYEKSKSDLYSGFIERCTELLADGGRLAMVTQQSFMFISSFEDLRLLLLNATVIESMVHSGPRTFPEVQGEKVNTTAFVLRRESFQGARQDSMGMYFRLIKEPDAEAKKAAFELALEQRKNGESDPRIHEYRQGDFAAISGNPWIYWISPSLRSLFQRLPSLYQTYPTKHGLTSGDNKRFIRMWWELGIVRVYRVATSRLDAVPKDRKWFPLVKSASKGKWVGLHHEVLNYARQGTELLASREDGTNPGHRHDNPDTFFRPGVAFPLLSSKGLSARMVQSGFIYDVSSPFVLTEQPEFACAFLNSSLAAYLLSMLNPTLNFPPGDVGRLPVKPQTTSDLKSDVQQAADLTARSINEDETTYSFVSPPAWADGGATVTARHEQLAHVERQIDKEIFRLYEISDVDRKAIEEDLTEVKAVTEGADNDADGNGESGEASDEHVSLTPEDLAKRWFSYGVGVALGRFQPGIEGALGCGSFILEAAAKFKQSKGGTGLMGLMEGHPDDLAARVVEILRIIHGDTHAEQIIHAATGTEGPIRQSVEEYLLGSFFKEHVKLYRKRPVYWLLQSPDRKYSAYLFHERATDQTLAILQSKRYLGGRIHILENDLQDAKSKESATSGREKALWVKKVRDLAEELEDLRAFDHALTAANNVPIKDAHGKPSTTHWLPEFDDGVLLNAAPLHELTPSWKRTDAKLDLKKAWKDLEKGEYDWAKTAMRYWPQRVLKACAKNKSFAIAHGLS